MSYSCDISFKVIKEGDIYPFFQSFKKEVNSKFKEIAEDNKCWMPSIRNEHLYREIPDNVKEELDRAWALNSMFKYRWFYLPEQQLLGVFSVDKHTQHLFDLTCYFQNSCDQDYEFEEWKGIPLFEEIAEKWKTASEEAVTARYKERDWGEDLETSDYDYYRRTFAYEEIWAMCKQYLDNESKVVYLSLFGFYEGYLLGAFCHLCRKAYEEDLEEWKRKSAQTTEETTNKES